MLKAEGVAVEPKKTILGLWIDEVRNWQGSVILSPLPYVFQLKMSEKHQNCG